MSLGHLAYASNGVSFMATSRLQDPPVVAWAPLDFIGMDCVKVAPAYGHAALTGLAAAMPVWTCLCSRLARRTLAGN